MLIRRLARPMLASIFIYGGVNALRDVPSHAKAAAPLVDKTAAPIRKSLPSQIPTDPESLVRIDAAVKIGAGVLLALGKWPRLASLLLAGSVVPSTLAAHRFWEIRDPQQRAEQRTHFLKNMGLFGGLLISAADTEGKPSMGYRARQRAERMTAQAQRKASGKKRAKR